MFEPTILSIDTSCDETSAAVTSGRRVLSNVISSQVNLHKKYGGVYPALAKRAHLERIDAVVNEAFKRAGRLLPLSAVAVTQGPGLAIALEVGIKKAKEISLEHNLPLISVNHMEGHIYSTLSQNKNGNPKREVVFPTLCLLVSGGHTQLVFMKAHGEFELIGETLDDACGEALDKAAKILKLGYPGGPIIERLSQRGKPVFPFGRPLKERTDLNFSYSGLKTQFLYLVESLNEKDFGKNIANLAASFQEAAFEQLTRKTSFAIKIYQPKTLLCGGGVIANQYLRSLLRKLGKKEKVPVFFPPTNKLIGDNAAMIGVAAYFKFQRKEFSNPESLDRLPRLSF
ncbi:tRNA (adenosine(37)-N6)-threonylcarbamoyltransferase complex transferase subunit TsaD [Candidatus Microgenomates bacterium]|jgi:N6-L-threonylcarbamoyladenine synthase|nr:MAG: tRNA (adenosine(37)-N6)-threonylcarbamoyltransferase complex transferase subunit TsaD [Candidatus Microgenomates bacterium]